MTKKRITKNYVNNKDFLAALVAYKAACQEAEAAGKIKPKIPDYIGSCVWQIATRFATKPNYSGYSFKDEMIMDAVENCLLYINSFDANKSSNPFAYFTTVVWRAFLRRIAIEKRQMYLRFKASQSAIASGSSFDQGVDEVIVHLNLDTDYMDTFIKDYEEKMKGKK